MLNGIRIVEFATYIAAPSAGGILCDWGAEVIKVEPPGADPMRRFMDAFKGNEEYGNPVFDLDNRGKKGIALNTATPEGREALLRLIKTADVLLTNVRPGALERAGLDYRSLEKEHPRLIYASVSGYGTEGVERDRPGFDMAAFWARSGMARLMAPKGTDPFPLRTAVGDHITGITTAAGILGALFERERTGKGRMVETSLLRTGIYVQGSDLSIQLRLGKLASTRPREAAINPIANYYKSGDGHWICFLTRQAEGDWHKLATAVDREDLLKDPRFSDANERRKNASELISILDAEFAKRPFEEWAVRLDEADLVWAPVQTAAEVVDDPQAIAAGAFTETRAADGTTYRSIAPPVRFHGNGEDAKPPEPAPEFGQDTEAVLRTLGYDEPAIAEMRKRGIIPEG